VSALAAKCYYQFMSNPSLKSVLVDSFEFDLYANKLWLPVIQSSKVESERAIFQHILSASKIWALRCEGSSPTERPAVALTDDALQALHESWLSAIDSLEYNDPVEYVSFTGVPGTATFGDIARHVVNHGTYHRGQLRQLLADRAADFPETDFILYAPSRKLQP
jgi:uncharacterized damage-inducible protein DinB